MALSEYVRKSLNAPLVVALVEVESLAPPSVRAFGGRPPNALCDKNRINIISHIKREHSQ